MAKVKKQQLILVSASLVLFIVLFFFGRTIPEKKVSDKNPSSSASAPASAVTTDQLIAQAKQKLNNEQVMRLNQLEKGIIRGDVKQQQIDSYKQLATFWGDSIHEHLLGAFYIGEGAKLENSEKNLNFAARLLLEEMMMETNPPLQKWMGIQAKALLEKSLEINPANDSAKVGIGACYLFGNISEAPMQGIQMVREVLAKDPHNAYAHMVLGLGGIKSGQLDKAIEHFEAVVKDNPSNMEAVFNLAESFDRKGDKANAIKWYTVVRDKIAVPEAKKEIDERIKALQ